MSTISFRVSEDEIELIKNYTKINNISMSSFIKNLILDKIEEDLNLDEERILNAMKKIKKEKTITSEELWERLDV
ncbi:DUF6290 domain-containing protein [Streptobacillus felis]|uniref:Antitoxin n=1 Tax=Streptobacillus felis TaxID=1384509 RepID=A0A7Z0PGE6_9FUSO|nr:DUF6290 family protein [Streptobacillus felis]NYV28233.1 antitoxin [Streptobacillus felis]